MTNMCSNCGKNQPLPGKRSCEICLNSRAEAQRKYLKNRPETRKRYYKVLRREVIEKYGGKCACCEEDRIPFLCIDHIDGGGNEERKTIKSETFFSKLKKDEIRDDLQVLCWNCNMGKYHYGICPHKMDPEELKNIHEPLPSAEKWKHEHTKIPWPSDEELIRLVNEASCNGTNDKTARQICIEVASKFGAHHSTLVDRLARRNLLHLIYKNTTNKIQRLN